MTRIAVVLSWLFAGLPCAAMVGLSVYFAVTVSAWWCLGLIAAALLTPKVQR